MSVKQRLSRDIQSPWQCLHNTVFISILSIHVIDTLIVPCRIKYEQKRKKKKKPSFFKVKKLHTRVKSTGTEQCVANKD